MTEYIVYDNTSGRILIMGHCREEDVSIQANGYANGVAVAVSSPPSYSDHYVVDGALTDRPMMPAFDKLELAADDVDVATLIGLPEPCVVKVDGIEHTILGGVLEISSAMPATYSIEIKHWPYKDVRYEIVAR